MNLFFYCVFTYAERVNQTLYPPTDSFQVCFTPKQRCYTGIVAYIAAAKKSIKIQAFSITSQPISDAVLAALKRGVVVEIIVDRDQVYANGSIIYDLAKSGIPIYIDHMVETQHSKIISIDETYTLTGSYNFTDSAENKNAENVLMIRDSAIVRRYVDNFNARKKISAAYTYDQLMEIKTTKNMDDLKPFKSKARP